MFSSPCIWVQGLIESKNSSALKAWFCANNLLNAKIRNAVPGVWLLHIIAERELAPRCASSKVHPLGIVCFCQHMELFPWRFTDSLIRGERNFGMFLVVLLGCRYCREEVSLFMGTWELEPVWILHGAVSTGATALWSRLSFELASMSHSLPWL